MKKETFLSFWSVNSEQWFNSAEAYNIETDELPIRVASLCKIKENIGETLYSQYEKLKDIAKKIYFKDFKDASKKFSRYKRAAIIAQTILICDPLDLIYTRESDDQLDPYLLKQRLAFYMGIVSIMQDFPQDKIEEIYKNDSRHEVFHFSDLEIDRDPDGDTFLMSVYKDMFFSELYKNYNILSMANIFGLLTECCSGIKGILIEKN